MKIKTLVLLSIFYSIIPACFGVTSPDMDDSASSNNYAETDTALIDEESEQSAHDKKALTLWQRAKRLAHKHPGKTIMLSTAALATTIVLINWQLNSKPVIGQNDTTQPQPPAPTGGQQTPPGTGSTPAASTPGATQPDVAPQPQEPQAVQTGASKPATSPAQSAPSTQSASTTQPATLTPEERERAQYNAEHYPILPGSFWTGYIKPGMRGHEEILTLSMVYKDAQNYHMPIHEWMHSQVRKEEIATKPIEKKRSNVAQILSGNTTDAENEVSGVIDAIVTNRVKDSNKAFNGHYHDSDLRYFDGYVKADSKKPKHKVYLSLPPSFKPTGAMDYVYLKTPVNKIASYRVKAGIAKDDKNNTALFAADYPESIVMELQKKYGPPIMISLPNSSTGVSTEHISFPLEQSAWNGTLVAEGRAIRKVIQIPEIKFEYLPINEKRRVEVLQDTANLVLKNTLMYSTAAISESDKDEASGKIMSDHDYSAIPVFEDTLGRFFITENTANPQKYFKVYLTLPTDFIPEKRTVSFKVNATNDSPVMKAKIYDLKTGLAKGGLNSNEYILYVTERPIDKQDEPAKT